ncbi:MAG TPA: hypothetical protein VGA29_09190, partial [Ignavibacteriaceae bacterium]
FDRYSQLDKITWLWCETNVFIHQFFSRLSEKRKLFVSSNDLFNQPETVVNIFRLIDVPCPSVSKIRKKIGAPVNVLPASKRKELSAQDISGIISFARAFSLPYGEAGVPDYFPIE